MDDVLKKWKNKPHGSRLQARAISYIAETIDMADYFAEGFIHAGIKFTLTDIINNCNHYHTPEVSVSTLKRLCKTYEEWGEMLFAAKIRRKQLRKK